MLSFCGLGPTPQAVVFECLARDPGYLDYFCFLPELSSIPTHRPGSFYGLPACFDRRAEPVLPVIFIDVITIQTEQCYG